ncbi:hypothetical protein [Alteromonas australica]|uniref:hypothetical protein n=1 Tax=Alteromonas australica TaxID=589873 RepID=UPI0035C7B9FB
MAASRSALNKIAYPDLRISEQYVALLTLCNGEVHIKDHDRTVVWHGALRPTPVSRTYSVTVTYTLGQSPKCIVTNPSLADLAKEKTIPHIYPNDTAFSGTQLCLYLPYISGKNKISEWSPKLSLVESIIPWASTWLFYFEDWLDVGEWRGGGVEHSDEDNEQ